MAACPVFLRWTGGALAVLTAGCASVGDYAASRALDLWDVVPVSVRYGPGAKVTVMATEFLGAGVGGGSADAAGLARGRWGPVWEERAYHFILTGVDQWWLSKEGERVRGWPGRARPSHRYFGRTLILIPAGLGPDGWVPARGGEPYVQDPWHSWADVEVDVLAGVGLRAGLCPGELVDFLAGLFGLDPFGDDIGGSNDQLRAQESTADTTTSLSALVTRKALCR